MPQIELHDGSEPILVRDYTYGWEICWKRNKTDTVDKTKVEQIWTAYKWYPTFLQAMDAVAEFKLRNSEATTLQELVKEVNKIKEEMAKIYSVKMKGTNK